MARAARADGRLVFVPDGRLANRLVRAIDAPVFDETTPLIQPERASHSTFPIFTTPLVVAPHDRQAMTAKFHLGTVMWTRRVGPHAAWFKRCAGPAAPASDPFSASLCRGVVPFSW